METAATTNRPASYASSSYFPAPSPAAGEGSSVSDPLLPTTTSYQQQQQGSGGSSSRAAVQPTISHYTEDWGTGSGDNNNNNNNANRKGGDIRDFFVVTRGDATLQPNTGETNSYDTAIFGWALHELLENIRLANIIAAVVAVVLLVVCWIIRLLHGQITRLVLSCYLAFLSVVLMLVEFVGIKHFAQADAFLKDNFGLVRHPIGKSVYIYMLSTICFGIGGVPEMVLGALYFVCATILLYAWFMYPEFRRRFNAADEDPTMSADRTGSDSRISWSDYASSFQSLGETASLLRSSIQT